MTKRRRFSGELKAKVALEALRGDRTLQEITSKHQVHPNQVSTWKRQAMEGLGEMFSNGVERRRRDHESEVRELLPARHAAPATPRAAYTSLRITHQSPITLRARRSFAESSTAQNSSISSLKTVSPSVSSNSRASWDVCHYRRSSQATRSSLSVLVPHGA